MVVEVFIGGYGDGGGDGSGRIDVVVVMAKLVEVDTGGRGDGGGSFHRRL